MKSLQLLGARQLAVREVPEPREIGPDEVLVRVESSGLKPSVRKKPCSFSSIRRFRAREGKSEGGSSPRSPLPSTSVLAARRIRRAAAGRRRFAATASRRRGVP